MADNRQVAYTLALVGGILSLVFAIAFALMAAAFGISLEWMGDTRDMGGPKGLILAMVGAFAFIALALGIATGILLLVAAPRLRSDDEATRRTWSTWTLVGGVVNLLGGNFIAGVLAIGAGVVTLMDLQQRAPSGPAP